MQNPKKFVPTHGIFRSKRGRSAQFNEFKEPDNREEDLHNLKVSELSAQLAQA